MCIVSICSGSCPRISGGSSKNWASSSSVVPALGGASGRDFGLSEFTAGDVVNGLPDPTSIFGGLDSLERATCAATSPMPPILPRPRPSGFGFVAYGFGCADSGLADRGFGGVNSGFAN
jgi:hypothetical protein